MFKFSLLPMCQDVIFFKLAAAAAPSSGGMVNVGMFKGTTWCSSTRRKQAATVAAAVMVVVAGTGGGSEADRAATRGVGNRTGNLTYDVEIS